MLCPCCKGAGNMLFGLNVWQCMFCRGSGVTVMFQPSELRILK